MGYINHLPLKNSEIIKRSTMFKYDDNGNFTFIHGKTAYEETKNIAQQCTLFLLDKDEDECVTSTHIPTCYNCLYRRWTHQSFVCTQKKKS